MAITRSALVAPGGAAWQGVSAPGLPFPASASGRVLLDQNGQAWYGLGDSPWSLFGELGPSDTVTYLDDRQAKGFNLIVSRAPDPNWATNAPNNYNNDAPWTGTAFQSTLNADYWDHTEYQVDQARQRGITILFNPVYHGFAAYESWAAAMAAASNTDMETYGGYLADRFASYPNIIWYVGHDNNPDATYESRAKAMCDVLRANTSHLIMPGGASGDSLGGINQWSTVSSTYWDMNQCYHYTDTPIAFMRGVLAATSLPTILQESTYEQEWSTGIGNVLQRQVSWGSFVGGGCGSFFGNNPIWHFDSGGLYSYTGTWQQNMDYAGSLHTQVFNEFIVSLGTSWATMTPDEPTRTFLTGGAGSGSTEAGARVDTTNGNAVVYMPTSRAVTLDLSTLTGSTFTITRVDPVDGSTSVLTTSASGAGYVVADQGTNSDGSDSDWALLVEAN